MGEAITFVSRVASDQRAALERLLFFNGCQSRFAHEIAHAIDRYGPPEIREQEGWLRVRVGGHGDVQSLFAVEPESGRPIGVAVYMRADVEHVTVLHLGLSEEYCAGGTRAEARLLLRLMKEIRRSSRRVKGVRRLQVVYGAQRSRALL